nr:putative copia-like polyprotein [Tanacetum cinerariifolium]
MESSTYSDTFEEQLNWVYFTLTIKTRIGCYADASYLFDPHKARCQTGYVFLNGGTAISWHSQKQTLVATSSNHDEVIPLHEASRECVWLRSQRRGSRRGVEILDGVPFGAASHQVPKKRVPEGTQFTIWDIAHE